MRMRGKASELRAHPLYEHIIVNRTSPEDAPYARDEPCRTMRDVHAGGTECIRAHTRCVRKLVADECAPAAAALGIEKVHEPNAEAQTGQQCPVIAEHDHPHAIEVTGV